jgi:hypothetical protein
VIWSYFLFFVLVAVVNVGIVLVTVLHRVMMVGMGMRFGGGLVRPVLMLMVFVVDMQVFVVERFVRVPMGMTLRQVEP